MAKKNNSSNGNNVSATLAGVMAGFQATFGAEVSIAALSATKTEAEKQNRGRTTNTNLQDLVLSLVKAYPGCTVSTLVAMLNTGCEQDNPRVNYSTIRNYLQDSRRLGDKVVFDSTKKTYIAR